MEEEPGPLPPLAKMTIARSTRTVATAAARMTSRILEHVETVCIRCGRSTPFRPCRKCPALRSFEGLFSGGRGELNLHFLFLGRHNAVREGGSKACVVNSAGCSRPVATSSSAPHTGVPHFFRDGVFQIQAFASLLPARCLDFLGQGLSPRHPPTRKNCAKP